MLRLIFTKNPIIRVTFVASLSLIRNSSDISTEFLIYQKGEWILVYSRELDIDVILPTILDNYDPDRIYIPYFGRSVDMMHEIGDIILPNVFISYVEQSKTDIDNDGKQANPLPDAKFLEIYNEQKDYYVEDYGLSIGGIVVGNTPHDENINTELMTAYEADIYLQESLDPAYTIASGDLVPAIILCGIIEGKSNKNDNSTPEKIATRNMLTTIRLMEEDE